MKSSSVDAIKMIETSINNSPAINKSSSVDAPKKAPKESSVEKIKVDLVKKKKKASTKSENSEFCIEMPSPREQYHRLTDEEFNHFMKNLGQPENMVEIKKKAQKMSKEKYLH